MTTIKIAFHHRTHICSVHCMHTIATCTYVYVRTYVRALEACMGTWTRRGSRTRTQQLASRDGPRARHTPMHTRRGAGQLPATATAGVCDVWPRCSSSSSRAHARAQRPPSRTRTGTHTSLCVPYAAASWAPPGSGATNHRGRRLGAAQPSRTGGRVGGGRSGGNRGWWRKRR